MNYLNGLSDSEVQMRIEKGETNYRVKSSTQTIGHIVKTNIFTYFNLVFLILTILLVLATAWSDMLFIPVIVSNILIGTVQEVHSKKILDGLSILNSPKTKVVRNGQISKLASEQLVLDDVIILGAGNQIAADATVIEGEISVNEALVTGESDEIIKKKHDELLSGSFVISGEAKARLCRVGNDSYVSKITMEATKSKQEEQSELIKSLNKLIKIVGIIIIPIGIAIYIQAFWVNKCSFKDSITSMVAAVIGMIPEGLYLLSSVAMAVSTIRLSKNGVLVHDMKCIETLARVNVLCVDKTGTITQQMMNVREFESLSDKKNHEIFEIMSDIARYSYSDNETMKALLGYFNKNSQRKAIKVYPFSSQNKFSGVAFENETYVIGAPEFILKEQFDKYKEKIENYSQKGYRVLILAKTDEIHENEIPDNIKALGIIILENKIRKGAYETFEYFRKNGVEVKVISGDNPLTASTVANEAGIENSQRYIDASTLKCKEDYYEAANKYTVFGRVNPQQKRLIISAIKQNGKTVAMTGDGINDVLALKDADCSIAMASGSDAASNVSQLVLLDSDFSRMPRVVMEGRRVVNNIQRTASLFLVKNIFSMLLAIFSVAFMSEYPFEPSQISLISLFTIGIPAFILALEPNGNPIKGKFLTNVMLRALPAGITDFILVSSFVIFCREFDINEQCISTSCTILAAIVGFMMLYKISKPVNTTYICMIIALISGMLYCMIFVNHIFAIKSVSGKCAMLLILFSMLTEPVFRILNRFSEKIINFLHKT